MTVLAATQPVTVACRACGAEHLLSDEAEFMDLVPRMGLCCADEALAGHLDFNGVPAPAGPAMTLLAFGVFERVRRAQLSRVLASQGATSPMAERPFDPEATAPLTARREAGGRP